MALVQLLDGFFDAAPIAALFVTVALGYFVGKLTIGQFVLGGVAGTLLVGVLIGQLQVDIDPGVKTIFFALFIYAVGYQGGPQFFSALNRRSLNQLASAFVMCLLGLGCVLAFALMFDLDRGTAAGLAAGGLTQSAIIGTADGALSKLDLAPDVIRTMQTNVAVGYAVCYIFGSLGPIIMVTWFLPTIMRWDIRAEAMKLEEKLSGGHPRLEPGQFNAVRHVVTRVFKVRPDARAIGKTALDIDRALDDAALEGIMRGGQMLKIDEKTVIKPDDLVAITGLVGPETRSASYLGPEVNAPLAFQLAEEQREVVLTNRQIGGHTLKELHDNVSIDTRHGIFVDSVRRMGRELPLQPDLALARGDELMLVGRPGDLDRVQDRIGYKITAAAVTDFIFFGIGMTVGVLLGLISFKIAGVPVSIGTGGGCLLSGLFFGWLRATHPRYAALPQGASNFLRDFGLAVFVAVVGLSAGPQALVTIRDLGATLFLLGVGVTLIPQVIGFFFNYYVLRIRNPIEALACVAGGRSANPGFAALMTKAGNATPVVAFTVTYAVANVFLTLWGPIIVGVITRNPSP